MLKGVNPSKYFTRIPNCITKSSLTLEEIGLYCTMQAVASESWEYSDVGMARLCNVGVDKIRKARKGLIDKGFLQYSADKNGKGQYSSDLQLVIPHMQGKSSNKAVRLGKTDSEKPTRENRLGKTNSEKLTQENRLGETNSEKPTRLDHDGFTEAENPQQYNTDTQDSKSQTEQGISVNQSIMTDGEIDGYNRLIEKNINLEDLLFLSRHSKEPSYQEERVREIYDLICHVVCFTQPTYRINKAEIPGTAVKSQFLKLTETHVKSVLNEIPFVRDRIQNINAYLITMLYNASIGATIHEEQDIMCEDETGMLWDSVTRY